jgi:hypothetical protein
MTTTAHCRKFCSSIFDDANLIKKTFYSNPSGLTQMFVTQFDFYHFLVLSAWRKRQSKTTELHRYVRRQVVRQQRKRIFEQKQKGARKKRRTKIFFEQKQE